MYSKIGISACRLVAHDALVVTKLDRLVHSVAHLVELLAEV